MDAKHRLFANLLLLRSPMALELEDIDAASSWVKRNALWLLAAYGLVLAYAVWPAFADARNLAYRVVAVAGTHVLLWIVASTVATCWVGFRVGDCASWRAGAIQAIVSAAVLTGLFLVIRLEPAWERALHLWLADTFGSVWVLTFVLVLAAYGVPDLVSRLRRRERAAVTRALQAEAAGERLARQTAESELRLLQAQVQPHFLFNTLANLRYLIQKNSPEALRMIDALIEYLRSSVPDMRAQRVTLGRELDHARNYLEIMQVRMRGRLDFEIDVPEALRAIEVPPLIVLTLVENALKHGISASVTGGSVRLHARAAGEDVELEVADTGAGPRAKEDAARGLGLENLRGRLALAYGRPVAVTLGPNEPCGARARIRIPRTMPSAAFAAAVRDPAVGDGS